MVTITHLLQQKISLGSVGISRFSSSVKTILEEVRESVLLQFLTHDRHGG
jgi:hypothetical protein